MQARAQAIERPVEEIREIIARYLRTCQDPVWFEPGEEPYRLQLGSFELDVQGGRLILSCWGAGQALTRRIVGAVELPRGRLELVTERFGRRLGQAVLADRANPRTRAMDQKSGRLQVRERFRKALSRQMPEWRIAELTSEPDLAHSLSAVHPRALLVRGKQGWAALYSTSGGGPALTFGLIWLDYLRRREPRLNVAGLLLFVPAGDTPNSLLRARYLDRVKLRIEVFACSEDGYEDHVERADFGNLVTELPGAPDLRRLAGEDPLVKAVGQLPGVDRVPLPEGWSFRIQGLEFARASPDEFSFGIETRVRGTPSHLPEIAELANRLRRYRDGGSPVHPLYRRDPERWMEAQVRRHLQDLDPQVRPEPVYGQTVAAAGTDRDRLDLLAVDRTGRLVVIELKASEDVHLPVQALDYWIRVKWHLERNDFSIRGYFPDIRLARVAPRLLLIAPAFELHSANETVMQYFAPEVTGEIVGVGQRWREEMRVVFRREFGGAAGVGKTASS
jgi:hypothetical protein